MAAAKKTSAKPVAKVKAGTVKTGSTAKTVKAVKTVKTAEAKKEKVVLAYSGGLDTTVIIPWLKENYNYDVIAVCINVGQDSELKNLEQRARSTGASKLYELDVIDEFCDEYIAPCIQAHAVYENKYLLGTSMARPLIAKKLVEIARKEGATAICHGATGKGNDQVRFELGIKALAPDLRIIAAWRDPKWQFDSREGEMEYCKQKGIHLPFSAKNSYSRDRNLWHISHEGLELEDPANGPDYEHMLVLGKTPEQAPDKKTLVTMTFEKGIPTSVNGKKMKLSDIIRTLNKIGGANGIGIVDIVENRVVGMKSRGVYETPGGTIIYAAHQQLEELILDRETYALKNEMGSKFASLVYEGKWFTPLREAEQAFIASTQEYVTGEVKFYLYKGNIIKAGETSPYSMYSASIASFTTGDLYDHHDAEGFINLFGLSSKIRAMNMQAALAKQSAGKSVKKK
jgi:argininosuccinate synthase